MWEIGASLGIAPAGGRSAVPTVGLWPREPKTLFWMERGWLLAWNDERHGDLGEEEMANLGLRCLSGGCGAYGFGKFLAQSARVVLRMSY